MRNPPMRARTPLHGILCVFITSPSILTEENTSKLAELVQKWNDCFPKQQSMFLLLTPLMWICALVLQSACCLPALPCCPNVAPSPWFCQLLKMTAGNFFHHFGADLDFWPFCNAGCVLTQLLWKALKLLWKSGGMEREVHYIIIDCGFSVVRLCRSCVSLQ